MLALTGCAELQKVEEPYNQIKLGTSYACVAVNPEVLPAEQRELYVRGCAAAMDGFRRVDLLLYGSEPAPAAK